MVGIEPTKCNAPTHIMRWNRTELNIDTLSLLIIIG